MPRDFEAPSPDAADTKAGVRRHAFVMEVLLDFQDAGLLPACWNEDGPTPIRRYDLRIISPSPMRRGPVYRRHGFAPHAVDISDAGAARLDEDLKADDFARATGLLLGEFLGLQLGRWLAGRSQQRGMSLFREMQFLRYKIDRARSAKKREVEATLRALLAEWRERYRPYSEVVVRDVLRKTIH